MLPDWSLPFGSHLPRTTGEAAVVHVRVCEAAVVHVRVCEAAVVHVRVCEAAVVHV